MPIIVIVTIMVISIILIIMVISVNRTSVLVAQAFSEFDTM